MWSGQKRVNERKERFGDSGTNEKTVDRAGSGRMAEEWIRNEHIRVTAQVEQSGDKRLD